MGDSQRASDRHAATCICHPQKRPKHPEIDAPAPRPAEKHPLMGRQATRHPIALGGTARVPIVLQNGQQRRLHMHAAAPIASPHKAGLCWRCRGHTLPLFQILADARLQLLDNRRQTGQTHRAGRRLICRGYLQAGSFASLRAAACRFSSLFPTKSTLRLKMCKPARKVLMYILCPRQTSARQWAQSTYVARR